MNFWNKVTIGTKFLFGGWESALDYLLDFLNGYLSKPNVSENVKKVYDTAKWALDWMLKLQSYVPEKWKNESGAIISVIHNILLVVEDGKIHTDELKVLTNAFYDAKAKWYED